MVEQKNKLCCIHTIEQRIEMILMHSCNQNMDKPHKHNAEETSRTKEYVKFDSIYVKFKNMQD